MKLITTTAVAACTALGMLTLSADAQMYIGPGGAIPDMGAGAVYSNWTPSANSTSLNTTIVVPVAVNTVDEVSIIGFAHTWLGDLHIMLVDPSGLPTT